MKIITPLLALHCLFLNSSHASKFGARFSADPGQEIWAKELAKDEWAVCLLNTQNIPADVTVTWAKMSFLPDANYQVRDLWKSADAGTTKNAPAYTAHVEAHNAVLFHLTRQPEAPSKYSNSSAPLDAR